MWQHFVVLRGSTCCAKTWPKNTAKAVIMMAHRRRDQRPRESDCHPREALLASPRNDHELGLEELRLTFGHVRGCARRYRDTNLFGRGDTGLWAVSMWRRQTNHRRFFCRGGIRRASLAVYNMTGYVAWCTRTRNPYEELPQ